MYFSRLVRCSFFSFLFPATRLAGWPPNDSHTIRFIWFLFVVCLIFWNGWLVGCMSCLDGARTSYCTVRYNTRTVRYVRDYMISVTTRPARRDHFEKKYVLPYVRVVYHTVRQANEVYNSRRFRLLLFYFGQDRWSMYVRIVRRYSIRTGMGGRACMDDVFHPRSPVK